MQVAAENLILCDQPSAMVSNRGNDLLILKILELEPMHGWGITQRIEQQSHGEFRIGPGSLYPAMHRLEV